MERGDETTNDPAAIPAGWRLRPEIGDLVRGFSFWGDVALGLFVGEVVETFQDAACRPVFDFESAGRAAVVIRFDPPIGAAQLAAARRIDDLPSARHARPPDEDRNGDIE